MNTYYDHRIRPTTMVMETKQVEICYREPKPKQFSDNIIDLIKSGGNRQIRKCHNNCVAISINGETMYVGSESGCDDPSHTELRNTEDIKTWEFFSKDYTTEELNYQMCQDVNNDMFFLLYYLTPDKVNGGEIHHLLVLSLRHKDLGRYGMISQVRSSGKSGVIKMSENDFIFFRDNLAYKSNMGEVKDYLFKPITLTLKPTVFGVLTKPEINREDLLMCFSDYVKECQLICKTTFRNDKMFHILITFNEEQKYSMLKDYLNRTYGFRIETSCSEDGLTVKTYMRKCDHPFVREKKYIDDVVYQLNRLSQLGTIHGDIKPQNIMIDGGHMWLIDFDNVISWVVCQRMESDERFYNFHKPPDAQDVHLMDVVIIKSLLL